MYEVQEWNNWSYPSHWSLVVLETDVDRAKEELDFLRGKQSKIEYRLIEVLDV